VFVPKTRLGLEHAVDDTVADGKRYRLQIVDRLELGGGADKGVANMPQDGLAQHFSGAHLGEECGRRLGSETGLVVTLAVRGGSNIPGLSWPFARTVRFVVVAYGAVPRRTLRNIF
jgi:hypothetical protein